LHQGPVAAIGAGPIGLQRLVLVETETATAMWATQANLCHGILLKITFLHLDAIISWTSLDVIAIQRKQNKTDKPFL
jgi:hypothetical protein